MTQLTPPLAARFMDLTLSHLGRQFPYKMDFVFERPEDAGLPIDHHPIFHGSFDWHSCVHGWWQVLRLARLFPALPEAAAVRRRADATLVPDKVAGERAFLDRASARGFERPYGWAWLLALHDEAACHDAPWAAALAPLAAAFAARFHDFLPRLTYPLRVGTHFNIAFALVLARRWAAARDGALVALIDARAQAWFGADADCQAWEPGGDEFLSSALTEALLMGEVLPPAAFRTWFARFLPRAAEGAPASLFTPAVVSDRSDGKIAHLDGLNLSRAWCWRSIAARLGEAHPVSLPARTAAEQHIAASLPHVAGDYMGEHWLATFALLALE
ncbi:DUF2891 domain-containing protein [Novosphingobium piscinae]|uniref:DUF2891 domain-containing protein n=1 Tax=Novosphingobium piscinae TaxID=1507448 RepID=A0A7X1FVC3_9SPHN|nr:DUF2891 domain-containing protein [Novosphingobium piscinae]MBC2667655.1 DUF2891 domain-containing protein [Novosphingobium piscinae]